MLAAVDFGRLSLKVLSGSEGSIDSSTGGMTLPKTDFLVKFVVVGLFDSLSDRYS